ncbi:MAG: hypothetical protein IID45_09235, partial [Planctomycetes bacterium]|nr:hypothetical protein [Planctomycetota bacterium]
SSGLIISGVCALVAQKNAVAQKNGAAKKKDTQTAKDDAAQDAITRQASALEAELGKYKDTAPEAANAMAQLVDLYHTHGRIFGLLRVGKKFVSSHPTDKRHAAVMLKLIDGLEAASRNQGFTANCRQFLARYPKAPQCAAVEIRLADTLNQMRDRNVAADADRAVFRRQPTTLTGRRHGVRAIRSYAAINNKAVYSKAAELSAEMLARLPSGRLATDIGNQAVYQWRRGSEWAKSNLAAGRMLKKGLPADPRSKRELHRLMAENFGNLGQYVNAVASLKQARSLGDNAALHYQHIYRLHQAAAKSAQMEPVVNDYLRKYPTRQDRFVAQSYLSYAFVREKNVSRAISLLAALLPYDAATNSNAVNYVNYSKNDKATNAQLVRVLSAAIGRNPKHANALRYTLAYYVYRSRMKDAAKTRQTLRNLVTLSPSNDGNTSNAVSWLLGDAADDNEFRTNLTLILASARKNLHLPTLRTTPAAWAKQNRKNKKLRTRTLLVVQEVQKLNRDPLVTAWRQIGNVRSKKAAAARTKLLAPASLKAMNDGMARQLLSIQGSHYVSYAGAKFRSQAALIYAMMAKRFPKDYPVAVSYLQTATDYSPAEVRKAAALHMLSLNPPYNSADVWRRLMIASDASKDPALVRRAHQWILNSQKKYGRESTYASTIGDVLSKYKMETEAVAYWTVYIAFNRNHYESRECATRLLSRIKKEDVEKRIRFVRELFKHDTDFHGRYTEWLAGYEFARGNLDAFEKTLRTAITRQDARLMRGWDFAEYTAQNWINAYRGNKEKSDADKRRVFTVIRDLRLLRSSATAKLSLLEITPPKSMPEMQRLIAYQSASLMVGNASHDWDRLMPHVQAALVRKDFPASAVLLTGMLTNISSTETSRKKSGRELVAQSYSRMGGVGLTIDEKSPIAPLLRAALYLRLGDQRLAFEAYTAHRALFDKHRNQVPVDLLLFVCENHIAAGGDKNHDYAEDVLRGWMVKNSESKSIEDLTKARVQLMLAQNFFKARRYDIARNEFTTVINRYAKTPQAIEAQFGIGETFMAQKVYDQAESVFEKLANSRDADVIVRAEFLRGVLTYRRGDKDEARKIFRSVL